MHLRVVFVLWVLSVVAESCDETHYMKDEQCCKKCWPGTWMVSKENCENPSCVECGKGEYQDAYTTEPRCKLHPSCDPNANLEAPEQSKTAVSRCVCRSGHHCTDPECTSCVRNTECQPGQKISKNGTQTTDAECEPCNHGTFSDHKSASTCKSWTTCSSGIQEVSPGSSTADRICEVQSQVPAIIISLVVIGLLFALLFFIFILYKKDQTGSISFVQKLRTCTFWGNKNTHEPVQDVIVENGQPQEPVNQPQEDTEDLVKQDVPLSPGLSENGLPVIQDNSKSLLLSETETEPGSFSDHFNKSMQ